MLPSTTIFLQQRIIQKTPTNLYGYWVYGTCPKVTKKRKKLPFGNFLAQNLFCVSFRTPDKTPNKKIRYRTDELSSKKNRKSRHIPRPHVDSARHCDVNVTCKTSQLPKIPRGCLHASLKRPVPRLTKSAIGRIITV